MEQPSKEEQVNAREEEVVEGSTLTLIVRCVGDRERQRRFYQHLLTRLGLASSN
jgi:hypothetical protein